MSEKKRCTCCGHYKLYKDFNRDRNRKDGYDYTCKSCRKEMRSDREKGYARDKVTPYPTEELLCRPIEHMIETFSYDELATIWDCSKKLVGQIVRFPYDYNEQTGQPNLSIERRHQIRQAVESRA